jgi:hypothetical protein
MCWQCERSPGEKMESKRALQAFKHEAATRRYLRQAQSERFFKSCIFATAAGLAASLIAAGQHTDNNTTLAFFGLGFVVGFAAGFRFWRP